MHCAVPLLMCLLKLTHADCRYVLGLMLALLTAGLGAARLLIH